MNRTTSEPPTDPKISAKTKELSREYERSLNRATDRLTCWLMVLQFALMLVHFGLTMWQAETTSSFTMMTLTLEWCYQLGTIAFATFLPATTVTQVAVCGAQIGYCPTICNHLA